MELAGLSLVKINISTVIKPFDCGDKDLNDFLLSKAKDYQNELFAVTFTAIVHFIIGIEKMGFAYFTDTDKGKDTRQMYLNLTSILNAEIAERVAI